MNIVKQRSYIIISIFILIVIMLIPRVSAAATLENIIQQYELKDKAQILLKNFSRNLLQNLSNTVVDKQGQSNKQTNLNGKKIVIDPGHGGHNPGAVRYQLRESDNNLAVALKLKNILTKQGASVIMTRTSDVSLASPSSSLTDELQQRVDIAHRENADIFVSLHTNSNENTEIAGAMTFYYDNASQNLAKSIQNGMINTSKAIDKGIAKGNFLVLRNNKLPAVLVEMGFITNNSEALKLNEDGYRHLLAVGIAAGIGEYYNNC